MAVPQSESIKGNDI